MKLFISHASEDKETFVRPLASALRERGLDVWFDEFSLSAGDSLRESIDRGLAQSTFGVVVLSQAFFRKKWTQAELNGLFAREIASSRKMLIPIWHGVSHDDITAISPILADRYALNSSKGTDNVCVELVDLIRGDQDLMYEYAASGRSGYDELICSKFYSFTDIKARYGLPRTSIFVDYPRKSWKREGSGPLQFFILEGEDKEHREIFRVPVNNKWVGSGDWERLHFAEKHEDLEDQTIIGLRLCSKDPEDYQLTSNSYLGERSLTCSPLAALAFRGISQDFLFQVFDEFFIL